MTVADLFDGINTEVLDLQGATLQTYERPLRRLHQLLNSPELAPLNDKLTLGLDFNEFMKSSERTGGGFAGSKTLQWPDDSLQDLGMRLLLVNHLAGSPDLAIPFSLEYYRSGTNISSSIRTMTSQLFLPFVRDYKAHALKGQGKRSAAREGADTNKVFIVHGHDGEARESVARFLERVGLAPVILHEQANRGRTIIEKVEAHSDVGFAVVILTPDDEGRAIGAEKLEARARQNVLLELGYFMARLGRENVCALKKGDLEIPSDFAGVVWSAMDQGGSWRIELGKELRAAGYRIDWNSVM